jgi:hypothetical protein
MKLFVKEMILLLSVSLALMVGIHWNFKEDINSARINYIKEERLK